MTKLSLIFHTVIHLRFIQVFYQVYYKLRNRLISPLRFASLKGYRTVDRCLLFNAQAYKFVPKATEVRFNPEEGVELTFLNVTHSFKSSGIDWNFENKGKLWNYNLNYFDFLFSDQVKSRQGRELLDDYCKRFPEVRGGNEPYPISLRGINWIKFFSRENIMDDVLNRVLYRQYKILMANVEYHILANHLIENGFSLLFAGYYFQNESFYSKAKSILSKQLNEQVLSDGAHFERSPMYHQIMLFRILDCINLIKHNTWKANELLGEMISKAESMLFWLNKVTFSNGDIPMVKDATFGIAPSTSWLNDYARKLDIQPSTTIGKLGESGYRKFELNGLELFTDVGQIIPSYQPGHAHADETNFILYSKGVPLIVDMGVSTYEKDAKRQLERSTSSHNCVSIDGQNSSHVWGGFRVAKRAKVEILEDSETEVSAKHNGYARFGVTIMRLFRIKDGAFVIKDVVKSNGVPGHCELRLHLHPGVEPEFIDEGIKLRDVYINTLGFHEVAVESYMFATGFNTKLEASLIRLALKSESKLIIKHAD